ncbi:MAG TPA: polysaccharide deacetylase family protein [Acidimicrobiales bacterium]|nr:polysaccharide deacetylase family protein [Acidimicrobiales bacterium]
MADRRRSGRWWVTVGAAAVALGDVAMLAGPHGNPVAITVDGRVVDVAGPHPEVADALAAAGLPVRDGALRSAASKRVVRAHAEPAVIEVNGRRANLHVRLDRGAVVSVKDGLDTVEPTVVRQVEVSPPPGPAVERRLWYPGAPGVDEQVVGKVSGEVVSSKRLVEPVAPRPEQGQVVALTFDDGPSPTWTPQVVQILAEKGVHATFCLVGDMVRKRPELTRAIAGHGHTLCSHTMDHPEHLDELPAEQAAAEVTAGMDILASVAGQPVPLFRAPAGRTTPAVNDLVHARGARVLAWTVDAEGSEHRSAQELLARIMAGLKPGAVILLHDGGGNRDTTVEVLGPLIDTLRAAGWQFATPTSPPPPAG